MPSVYDLKPKFQDLLRPIVRRLAAKGITANQVTLFAALLSCGCGLVLWGAKDVQIILLSVPIVMFVRMALNAIDGMLAREHDMKTDVGAILNELGDVISDTGLFLPLAAWQAFSAEIVVCFVVLAVVSEMTGVLAIQICGERRYDGPMGKSDRALLFGVICLLLGLGVSGGIWVHLIMGVALILLGKTIYNRGRSALKSKMESGLADV